MRKKLLSLVAMAFVAIAAIAQSWQAPVRPALPEGTDPVSGEVYRVLNVEAGQFLAGGKSFFSWSTTAVLSDYENSIQFTLTHEFDEELGDDLGWTFKCFDGTWPNCYVFISGNGIEGNAMHVDNATDVHRYFELLKQSDGYYHIRTSELDDTYGSIMENWASLYWGWGGAGSTYPNGIYASVDPEDGYYCDWIFGQWTEDEIALVETAFELYRARLSLYNKAQEAATYSIDYTPFTEAYNGESLEDIQEAIDQLNVMIAHVKVEQVLDGATEDSPKDGTSLLTNPSFDEDMKGWTIGKGSATPATMTWDAQGINDGAMAGQGDDSWGKNCEVYNAAFDISQTLPYMPAGVYKFTCQGFYRNDTQNTKAQLYAILPDGTEQTAYLSNIKDYPTDERLWTSGSSWFNDVELDGKWIPNGMNGAMYHFHHYTGDNEDPDYTSTLRIILDEPVENLTIGVRTTTDGTWVIFDNFTLTYYGMPSIDPYQTVLEELVAKLEAKYNMDEIYANAEVKEAFTAALEAAKTVKSEFQEEIAKVNAAEEALEASIEDYKRLNSIYEQWSEKAATVDGTKWAEAANEVADKLEEINEGYTTGSYTVEDIDAAEDFVSNTFANVIGDLVEKGDDLTFLLNNPGFDTDFSGWDLTEESVAPVWGGAPVTYINLEGEEVTLEGGNAERYHAAFDMFQTIKNMPAGLFTLSCQAFERDDNGAGIEAELYAILPDGTEKTVKLLNLKADGSETQLFDGTQGTDNRPDLMNGSLWIPDGMNGANIYFAEGFYKNFFDFRVDERGDITIGVRTKSTGDWVLFDDFKIVYKGDDANAYKETLERLIDEAENILVDAENGEHIYTTNSITNLDSETQNAGNMLDNIDTASKEEVVAVIDKLQAAIDYANKSVELIDKLTETGAFYQELLNNTTAVSDNSELQDLLDQIDLLGGTYDTNEEIEGWLAEMPVKWFAYVLNQDGFSTATEQDPLNITDLILNPSFDMGNASYWTIESLGDNNQYQSASYTNEVAAEDDPNYGVTISGFAECWRNGAILSDGMIYQTLAAALPAGYYRLECDGHAVAQMGYPEGGIQGAYLAATNGTTYWQTAMGVKEGGNSAEPRHYAVDFESNGTDLITVGLRTLSTNANWITGDNFELYYLGTTAPTAVERIDAATEAHKAVVIYNLAGQRVQKPVRGLYIINGRKVLVK